MRALGVFCLETIQTPSLSHSPVTPQGKRKEEGPCGMGGASLPPWSGLGDFGKLVKGLSGEEEDPLERNLRRSSNPSERPWQAYLHMYPPSLFPVLVLDHVNQQFSLWAFAVLLGCPPAWAGQILTCLLVLSLDITSPGKPYTHHFAFPAE